MKRCCIDCFSDGSVRDFVAGLKKIGDCDYCCAKGVLTGDIASVGELVRDGLRRAYRDAAVELLDPRDEKYLGRDSAESVVATETGIRDAARAANLPYDLIAALSDGSGSPDNRWLEDGCGSIARQSNFYRLYGVEDANEYTSCWDAFKSSIMHNARFFDVEGARESWLQPILALFRQMEGRLSADETIFRARPAEVCLPSSGREIQEALGPAPVSLAKNNRMSPRGISYFYGSGDQDTCIAEIQPNVGSMVWVARFRVQTDIRLLDFTRLPDIEIPSIFSERYDSSLEWADFFLSRFLTEIQQPPRSKDDPLEYVPTQVLAEYIRAQGYQGIKFRSAQHRTGVNYTLFCRPAPESGVIYHSDRPFFYKWLLIEEVTTIEVAGLKPDTIPQSSTGLIDPSTLKDAEGEPSS